MENSEIGTLTTFQHYVRRYAFPTKKIDALPSPNLQLVVVIPAYREPDTLQTLLSLTNCEIPEAEVEVIVVINYSENDGEEVKEFSIREFQQLTDWASTHNGKLTFHIIHADNLPHKFAGPGLARKIGMDEAIRRFLAIQNPHGIIVSLDADAVVESNYLTEIVRHWNTYPNTNGLSIHFEHPLDGSYSRKVYDSIIDYELHLRYYINVQIYCGFPYAYQTVGSSFAVSANAYCKQGGMNRRKAGEDFYFIQKIIPLGEYYNLTTTTVFPSPRPSDRVPFGTGRTISDLLANKEENLKTYHFQSFMDLKKFLELWEDYYYNTIDQNTRVLDALPASISTFLTQRNFLYHLRLMKDKTSKPETFKKAFFRWFNAFTLMKFMHYSRDHFYPNEAIKKVLDQWLTTTRDISGIPSSKHELLLQLRENDKRLFQVE